MKRIQTKKRARVLIVDDHPAVREALASRISRQPDLEVCGEAANMVEAIRLVADTQPDLAVVDISLKAGNGIDLIKRLRERNDGIRTLVWSMHSESLYAERALRAGALGYITKDVETDKIVDAIRRVLDGKVYLSDAMADKMLHRAVGTGRKEIPHSPLDTLADRELEVFRMIGQGLKTAQIAERMHLSIKTVETYRDRIRHKLGLSDGAQLAQRALQWAAENG